jgi:transposase
VDVLSIGIDVAQKTLAVALWSHGIGRSLGEVPNTPEGFEQLARLLSEEQKKAGAERLQVTLEPTGGYELAVASFALSSGWRVSLPNPRHVRDFAKGLGQRAKTDDQDALLLARFGAERRPPAWAPLPASVSELESLLERKADLEQMLLQERNRKQGVSGRPGVAAGVVQNVGEVIEALERALEKVEAAIKQHLKQQPELKEQARQLAQVPGIGQKSVLSVLVLMHRWSTRTGGQGRAKGLAAFVGLDPQTHRSGTSVRGREGISRMGDRSLRARLYMCALGGVTGKNALRQYYQGMVDRGKAKKVALVAAARKVLIWAWAVFRDHQGFQAQKALPRAAATA